MTREVALRRRSPWLSYLALFVTSGLFVFPWLVLMMNDANAIEGKVTLPAAYFKAFFILVIPIYAVVLAFPFFSNVSPQVEFVWLPSAAAVLAVALLVAIFMGVILISRYVARIEGRRYGFADALLSVILTVLLCVSFIVMQRQLNRLPRLA